MLPWLEPKKMSSVIIQRRGKSDLHDAATEVPADKSNHNQSLETACEDLLKAIDERSVLSMTKAFKDAFDALESQPHEEYEEPDAANAE